MNKFNLQSIPQFVMRFHI